MPVPVIPVMAKVLPRFSKESGEGVGEAMTVEVRRPRQIVIVEKSIMNCTFAFMTW